MPKRPARDNLLLYVIGIVTVVLAVGFGLAWLYLQYADKQSREINYLNLPQVAISRDGHSISASFAVRTSAADAKWASQNKSALEQVMKQSLLAVDPVHVRAPNGLQALQNTVRDASNLTLHTDKVQEVLVTDFLVSEGDL
jgi:hypothetical protein